MPDQDLLNLDLPSGMVTADLKALIQSETNFPPPSQHLYHNGQLLTDDSKALEDVGIHHGDMLAMHIRNTSSVSASGPASSSRRQNDARSLGGPGPGSGRGAADPEVVRLNILGNPQARAELQRQNRELADAIEDPQRFRRIFMDLKRREVDNDRARQQEIARLNDDPFNPEAQAKIEELIRQENIMENLQHTLEYNPEAFAKVYMLYVPVEVNGHKVNAFVDSGAQATIMSPSCAEACGIMRLVDKRFAGLARGVGTANIIGRVHGAQIKIGSVFLECSFTVMEGKDVDLLLGLDMLKRHQATINLVNDTMSIQGVEIPFLGEADIPKNEEEKMLNEPTVEGPSGIKVGAKSGAVLQAAEPTPAAAGGPSTTPAGGGQPGPSQPQPPPQSAPPPQNQGSAPAQSAVSPEAVAQLQALGFSRDEAIAALNATGGNIEHAAGLLFPER
ncbi:MAG: DNA damage-inducible protein 1 [Piccolia ochrophora]|nr:MAG: DNA damage-inducible protein 1 [Piccolia ochrophora]